METAWQCQPLFLEEVATAAMGFLPIKFIFNHSMMRQVIFFIGTLLVLSGCYFDKEEELYPNSFGVDTTTYYYAKDIKPLVDTYCATGVCHKTGFQLPDLSTYAGLSANATRVRVRAVEQRSMPAAGPLPVSEINKIRNWIDAGALDN